MDARVTPDTAWSAASTLKNATSCCRFCAWLLISSAVAAKLLGRGGVLLGDLVQLCHRGVDLPHARGLLLRRRRDLLHEVGGLLDRRHHFPEKLARLLGDCHRRSRHLADLLRRDLAALGELANLARHHGESLAVLARARRLDRGVEREQVRLIGDVVDDADLLGYVLHRGDGLLDRRAALARLLGGLQRHAIGHLGVLRRSA